MKVKLKGCFCSLEHFTPPFRGLFFCCSAGPRTAATFTFKEYQRLLFGSGPRAGGTSGLLHFLHNHRGDRSDPDSGRDASFYLQRSKREWSPLETPPRAQRGSRFHRAGSTDICWGSSRSCGKSETPTTAPQSLIILLPSGWFWVGFF